MIHLKSVRRPGNLALPRRTGILISPDVPLHNDAELYAAVKAQGFAVVREYDWNNLDGSTGLPPLGGEVHISPTDFQLRWQGD